MKGNMTKEELLKYNNIVKVLDHGSVRLVDYMGGDLSIVQAARVSHDATWRTGEDAGKDEKLINYLKSHFHNTPFEMVEFKFEVKLPIFVVRQWHRHRTWSYNEVSARYTELPKVFYVPELEQIGIQSAWNKQCRDTGAAMSENFRRQKIVELQEYRQHCEKSFELYRTLLDRSWPREIARCVLPFATYTKMFAKVDLHNLFHFLTLRNDSHSQYEIRVYAQAMEDLIQPIIPVAFKAFKDLIAHWKHLATLPDEITKILGENVQLKDLVEELKAELRIASELTD